jgi:hypothetical protein
LVWEIVCALDLFAGRPLLAVVGAVLLVGCIARPAMPMAKGGTPSVGVPE